jgi:hypothetical protein
MTGNCHVRFLEGRASAMGSGYSISYRLVLPTKPRQFLSDSNRDSAIETDVLAIESNR